MQIQILSASLPHRNKLSRKNNHMMDRYIQMHLLHYWSFHYLQQWEDHSAVHAEKVLYHIVYLKTY